MHKLSPSSKGKIGSPLPDIIHVAATMHNKRQECSRDKALYREATVDTSRRVKVQNTEFSCYGSNLFLPVHHNKSAYMEEQRWHRARMAAAQHVFSSRTPQRFSATSRAAKTLSVPYVKPDEITLDRFWRRVADLTTRYYDADSKWIGGEEIRRWNNENRTACDKCLKSKTSRVSVKIGCDRKARFVFDLTKGQFFTKYEEFLAVFNNKEPGRLRRYSQAPRKRGYTVKEERRQGGCDDENMQSRLISMQDTEIPIEVRQLLKRTIPVLASFIEGESKDFQRTKDRQTRLIECIQQIEGFLRI
ncbi:hypothetical protein C8R43DRAFT_960036 [Mycena crocata]|nr:hypothetical protein C8R43DRAFT_960036 [Mycena crocata]